jgi:hypothetical protein
MMSINRDQPQFEVVDPPFHVECGHFHWSYEECPQTPCDSYMCCRDQGDSTLGNDGGDSD